MPAPKNLHKKKAADRRVSFGDRKPPTLEPPDPEHNISSSALDEIPAELTGNLEASSPAERRISSASAGDTSRSSEDHKTSQSLTLPTDQRVSTTSSRRNSLPAHRGSIGGASSTLNGRRSSNSTQSSGKRYSIVTEDGIVFSEACTSDDLVDNLTKQKMNMQLKNVTDRIADVLDEYDKRTPTNPKHRLFGSFGSSMGSYASLRSFDSNELDDITLKTNIMHLITDYNAVCTQRENVLLSLAQWFSADHMKNFLKFVKDRERGLSVGSEEYPDIAKSVSQETKTEHGSETEGKTDHTDGKTDHTDGKTDKTDRTDRSSVTQQQEGEEIHSSASMSQLSVMQKRVSERTGGKSIHEIEEAWSSASTNMCELLHWARSEGVADLQTVNSFLETMADHSEVFKGIKEELQQQKQVNVIGDMTIRRLTEENSFLQKSADMHEDEMTEVRRTIKQLQRQVKDAHLVPLNHQLTQTDAQYSPQYFQLRLKKNEAVITELKEKLTDTEKENERLKVSYDNMQKEFVESAELYDKEILLYKEEVDRLMETITREDEATPITIVSKSDNILSATETVPSYTSSLPTFPVPKPTEERPATGKERTSSSSPLLDDPKQTRQSVEKEEFNAEIGPLPLVLEPQHPTPDSVGTTQSQSPVANTASTSLWSDGGKGVQGIKVPTSSIRGSLTKHDSTVSWKKLQVAMRENTKVRGELMEKDRLLKVAEREIYELKQRLHVAMTKDAGGNSLLSDMMRPNIKALRNQLRFSLDSIKRFLLPGQKMTEANIERLLASNNDRFNVKLVRELVNQLNIRQANFDDASSRSKVVCNVQNACNMVAHLQEKVAYERGLLPDQLNTAAVSKHHEAKEEKDIHIRVDSTTAQAEAESQSTTAQAGVKSDQRPAKPLNLALTLPIVCTKKAASLSEVAVAGQGEAGMRGSVSTLEGLGSTGQVREGDVTVEGDRLENTEAMSTEIAQGSDRLLAVGPLDTQQSVSDSHMVDGGRGKLAGTTAVHVDTRRAASDSRMGMSESMTLVGHKLKTGTRKANLIQQVVDISKSGAKELESANPEYFLEVESQLQEACNNLATLVIKKFNHDEEDAEQLLLREALAASQNYYMHHGKKTDGGTGGISKRQRARRQSYSEGVSSVQDMLTDIVYEKGDEKSRRMTMPEDEMFSSRDTEGMPTKTGRAKRGRKYNTALRTQQLREALYRRGVRKHDLARPVATLPAVYHLDEEGESLHRVYSFNEEEPVVLKGNRLAVEIGDSYSREAHRKRALELYSQRAGHKYSRQADIITPVAANAVMGSDIIFGEQDRRSPFTFFSHVHHSSPEADRSVEGITSNEAFAEILRGGRTHRHARHVQEWRDEDDDDDPFPLMLEKYMLPALVEKTQQKTSRIKRQQKRHNSLGPYKHTISIHGNSITPPPQALGFARRAGKYRTSIPNSVDGELSIHAVPSRMKDAAELFRPGYKHSFKSGPNRLRHSSPKSGSNFSLLRSGTRSGISAGSRPGSRSIPSPYSGRGSKSYFSSDSTIPALNIVKVKEDSTGQKH